MSISKAIFGKDLFDLELRDLQSFFELGQEETEIIEFKTGDVSLEKIYSEVSAFLNTQGGLLIIGAPKEAKGG